MNDLIDVGKILKYAEWAHGTGWMNREDSDYDKEMSWEELEMELRDHFSKAAPESGDVETEKQFLWAAFLEGIQTGGKTIQFPAIDFSSFLNKIHFPHHHAYFADKDTPKTGEQ